MQLPKEAITEFQSLYLSEFKVELSFEEAELYAADLLELYALLIPNPHNP